ncbi:hypothetical protein FACS1894133_5670 [Clostridia bacterium]|nr:hypothetical protein FACS1894133_5670 [Clostridia bacterium]
MKSQFSTNKSGIVLSVSMIVKNEAENLDRCLTALKPLLDAVPSELLITDTGSTDGTVRIAERHGAKVMHFAWCDDFGAARNFGLDQCVGEWFMFLDGDEFFGDLTSLIEFFKNEKLRARYDVASYIQRNFHSFGDPNDYSDLATARIARMKPGVRFYAPVHEMLKATGRVYPTDSYVNHYGYIGKLGEKQSRNNAILEKILEKDPNNVDALMNYISPDMPGDYKQFLTERINHFLKHGEYLEKVVILKTIACSFRLDDPEFALFACNKFLDVCRESRPVHTEVLAAKYIALKKLNRMDEAETVLAQFMRRLTTQKDAMLHEDATYGLTITTTPVFVQSFRKYYSELIALGKCDYDDMFMQTLTYDERGNLYKTYYDTIDKQVWYKLFANKNGGLIGRQAYLMSCADAVSNGQYV